MKIFLVLMMSYFTLNISPWFNNLDEAKLKAKADHKLIVLNFSGSDWCGPCIKMHKQLFDSQEFLDYSKENLVLVNVDFPRMKKNQPDKKQLALNSALADKYNKEGIFPLTLLLDENGKVIKKWEGLPKANPSEFVAQIKKH
ncbi:thioredoxin family protein [Daejeonella oryzae]|uniref:thioredoxin family protein n=1 Tax=Daejeonella oryzae TaxID=1122943 RepID=UPI0003F4F1E7|nr:thioredoxin family protein [Daejeonella oryzae]